LQFDWPRPLSINKAKQLVRFASNPNKSKNLVLLAVPDVAR